MAGPNPTKSDAGRRAKAASSTPAHAYEVEAGAVASLKLPAGAKVVVIPQTKAADAALRRRHEILKQVRYAPPGGDLSSTARAAARSIQSKAYEPNGRAKAILRGVAHAEQDLAQSGGAFELADVQALLRGVSRQAIDKRVADGSLLAIPGPKGRRRFPTVQFNDDGRVVGGLREVQAALGYTSGWSVLNFLVNGHDLLDGRRPVDLLREGKLDEVLAAARRTGVQGA